jgi:head-tail adaptor
MSWMVPKLNRKIQIQKGENTPVSNGAFERTYTTLIRIWAEIKINNRSAYIAAIRNVNTDEEVSTHIIKIRKSSVSRLGTQFKKSFSSSFDSISDINAIKSNYFIFIEEVNNQGRRLKINGIQQDEKHREYIKIIATEIEERGSGE